MSKAFIFILAVMFAQSANASVTTCNLRKIVKATDGSETISSCHFTIDSKDMSGSQGSGGINHDKPVGTANSDCDGLPANYDANGFVKYIMYDQGANYSGTVDQIFDFITMLGYLNHGSLGFDKSQVASVQNLQGGIGVSLIEIVKFYDKNNVELGMVMAPTLYSPKVAFQGCYTN